MAYGEVLYDVHVMKSQKSTGFTGFIKCAHMSVIVCSFSKVGKG